MENLSNYADPNIKVILIGNKSDIAAKRVVSEEEGKKEADKYKMEYLEASAKSKANVGELFIAITEGILENRAAGKGVKTSTEKGPVTLSSTVANKANSEEEKKKGGCC